MGRSYSQCQKCKQSFDDCSPYVVFCCSCKSSFCSEKCAKPIMEYDEDEDDDMCKSCIVCRNEYCPDYMLMNYLLKQLNLTKEQAQKQCLKALKNEKTAIS